MAPNLGVECVNIQDDEKYGAMTGAEVVAFLSRTRVPMRLAIETSKGPLVVPLWFHFAADQLWACSMAQSLVIKSLQQRPTVAFDISTNDPPYKGVRGRGTARCVAADGPHALDKVLAKYVKDDQHSLAVWLRSRADEEVAIAITPTWLNSWDFSERMRGL
jgi:nitroimidazol reductase NimA-like FMN-containing flavoprotein (pyridoxamine 5'-phosphate oxidase superfamily)